MHPSKIFITEKFTDNIYFAYFNINKFPYFEGGNVKEKEKLYFWDQIDLYRIWHSKILFLNFATLAFRLFYSFFEGDNLNCEFYKY